MGDWVKKELDSHICLFVVCLLYVVLVEVYEENLVLYRYVVAKGRSILIAF